MLPRQYVKQYDVHLIDPTVKVRSGLKVPGEGAPGDL